MNLDEANTLVAQAQTIYPGFASTIVPSGSEPDREAGYVVTLAHPDGFTMTIHTLQVWLNHLRDMVRPTVRVVAQKSGMVTAETSQDIVNSRLRHSINYLESVIHMFTALGINCTVLQAHVASTRAYLTWREGGQQGDPPEGWGEGC